MSMNYRRPISWTCWEQRWAQREAELPHLQTRGMRLLIVGSLILLSVGLTLIANKWPLAHTRETSAPQLAGARHMHAGR